MKKIIKIFVIAVVAIVGIVFIKNFLVQLTLNGALSKAANVTVHIGKTNIMLRNTTIDLRDIRIQNPRGFKDPLMLNAPQIFISFDLPAFFMGKTHFRDVRLNLKEIVVVKNEKGELNIEAMKPKEDKKKEATRSPSKAPKLLGVIKTTTNPVSGVVRFF